MPAIRRLAQQKLPLAELQEELCREREATEELLDEIKDISISLTINAVSTGPWLADLAARMESAISEHGKKRNEYE